MRLSGGSVIQYIFKSISTEEFFTQNELETVNC